MGRQMEGVRIAPSTGVPWEGANTFSDAHAGNGFLGVVIMVDGGDGTQSLIFEFAISLKMALNFLTSCLHLWSARITGVCHCARQALFLPTPAPQRHY